MSAPLHASAQASPRELTATENLVANTCAIASRRHTRSSRSLLALELLEMANFRFFMEYFSTSSHAPVRELVKSRLERTRAWVAGKGGVDALALALLPEGLLPSELPCSRDELRTQITALLSDL